MHSDTHLMLHHLRTAELAAEARLAGPSEHRLRIRLGWILVELGLRLTRQGSQPRARLA
ncbi:hypothetical protein [Streptomyces sp. NPDC048111]|uniref:hypothetical protein n=1 Tax=Streptomyces sp. NPDC048111 TaxID=3365500 RepID=UPI0037226CA5